MLAPFSEPFGWLSTTNSTRAGEPTLSCNQLRSLTLRKDEQTGQKKGPSRCLAVLGCLSFVQEGPRISWAETAGSMHLGGIYSDFNPSFFAPEQRPFAHPKSTVLNKLSSVSSPHGEGGCVG